MEPFAWNLIMILCFVLGSGLIILEAFIPGFGAAGVAGVLLELVALWSVWQLHGIVWALVALFGVLCLIGLAVFLSYRSAMKGRLSCSPLVLKETEEAAAREESDWLNREGVALSPLRPAGVVEVDGVRLNAESSGEFIEKGSAVRVTGRSRGGFTVQRIA